MNYQVQPVTVSKQVIFRKDLNWFQKSNRVIYSIISLPFRLLTFRVHNWIERPLHPLSQNQSIPFWIFLTPIFGQVALILNILHWWYYFDKTHLKLFLFGPSDQMSNK